ncbi:MAG TPA: SDR family oxidoreductase [Bacteroidales bacterium]|nr:SDR family oxidoreductase [Bacteroidales bacterium]
MEKIIENSKILVTGGAGFIGSALVETLLSAGNQVVCLDNLATGKLQNIAEFRDNKNFCFVEGDIRNMDDCRKAVAGSEIVLHQAALGSVPRSVKDPVTSNEVNVSGFLNMITAARDAGVKRFVYASSSSVYGDHPALPKLEENTGNPLSPYAVTKKVNELYAKVFGELYGMQTLGLRYFNVFGRRQDPDGQYAAVIPRFVKSLINHEAPVIFGDGSQTRDFTYIENVVQANLRAAVTKNPEAYNTAYNVAFGDRVTLNELYTFLRDGLSKFDPAIAAISPVYSDPRQGDIPHSLASIEKTSRLLGYNPQFNLRQGLEHSVKWYWEHLK